MEVKTESQIEAEVKTARKKALKGFKFVPATRFFQKKTGFRIARNCFGVVVTGRDARSDWLVTDDIVEIDPDGIPEADSLVCVNHPYEKGEFGIKKYEDCQQEKIKILGVATWHCRNFPEKAINGGTE